MPRGDLPHGRQVIAEDFAEDVQPGGFAILENGLLDPRCAAHSAYGKRLGAYSDGPADHGGVYRPGQTLSVADSVLDIHARPDSRTGALMCAAVVPFRPGVLSNSHTYGRWSYRMRAHDASGPGVLGVALLFPEIKSQWPRSGEADWPESDVAGILGGNHHPAGSSTDSRIEIDAQGRKWSAWHTFTIDWRPGKIAYEVDGHTALSATTNAPSVPMKWVVQCAPDPLATSRDVSARIQLDWVVAYDPA